MTDMEIEIRQELEGSARVLAFNRPAKKNALTLAMYTVLAQELAGAASQPEVRAVVLTGTGDTFTAGNDIHDFMANPPTSDDSPVVRFLGELVRFPKPIIAAVNGPAIGVGTTMLLHCDLVLSAESARFQTPFTKLALNPEAGSSFLLPRLAGLQKASELLIWGEPFDALAAERAGIVNEVVPGNELMSRVLTYLEKLRELPPEAVQATKALLREPLREQLEQCMRREAETFRARLASSEALEAFTAFFEKRKPR
jgi:enoyl-CoA hydratase/carnithine racemase